MALPFNLPPTLFSAMASPMNQPYAPMYQPPPQTGVSSVIERLQSGMGGDYTSRLLSNLNLPSASQFAAMAPTQQPAFNPYAQMYNPYAGMFESLLARIAQLEGAQRPRLTPDGREQFDPTNVGAPPAPVPDWLSNFFDSTPSGLKGSDPNYSGTAGSTSFGGEGRGSSITDDDYDSGDYE